MRAIAPFERFILLVVARIIRSAGQICGLKYVVLASPYNLQFKRTASRLACIPC